MREILKRMENMEKKMQLFNSSGSSSMVPNPIIVAQLTNIENNRRPKQSEEDYYDVFILPLLEEIHNFSLPPEHKGPKFKMFSGEHEPK